MSSPPAVRIPVKKVWVLPPDEFGHRYVMALFKDRGETMVAQLGIVGQLGGDTALADYEAGRPVYIRRRGGQKQDWSPGAELGGASAPPSRKRGVIRAYHQVGTDAVPGDDRALLLDRILEEGFVSPATERVKRAEMEEECFGDAYVEPLDIRFQHASREGLRALREMARDVIGRLPEEGTTHTLFNCVDLLAGDLGRIFLSLGNWYQGIPNGLPVQPRNAGIRQNDVGRPETGALEVCTQFGQQCVPDQDLVSGEGLSGCQPVGAIRKRKPARTRSSRRRSPRHCRISKR